MTSDLVLLMWSKWVLIVIIGFSLVHLGLSKQKRKEFRRKKDAKDKEYKENKPNSPFKLKNCKNLVISMLPFASLNAKLQMENTRFLQILNVKGEFALFFVILIFCLLFLSAFLAISAVFFFFSCLNSLLCLSPSSVRPLVFRRCLYVFQAALLLAKKGPLLFSSMASFS